MAASQPTNHLGLSIWTIWAAGNKAGHTYILAPDHARAAKLVFLFVAALEWLAFWGTGITGLFPAGLGGDSVLFFLVPYFPCFGQDGFGFFLDNTGERTKRRNIITLLYTQGTWVGG
jgi:hypothetical protein